MSIELKAAKREALGGKVKALRKTGVVPGNLQGRNIENVNIQINEKDLQGALKASGTTNIIDLDVDGTKYEVLLREVERTPNQQHFTHVEFYAPDMNVAVRTTVKLKFVGESKLVVAGGILVTPSSEIEVSALPKALPEFIQIDTSDLKDFSDVITVGSLPKIEGVNFTGSAGTALAYVAETRATRAAKAADQAAAKEAAAAAK